MPFRKFRFFILLCLGLVGLLSGRAALADSRPGSSKPDSNIPTALVVQDLTGGLTATDLANALVGTGVSISNVVFTGDDAGAGGFSGGTGIIGFEEGIILSSGSVLDVVGPNVLDNVTTEFLTAGDSDLDTLSGFNTHDAVVLEFDFVPDADQLFFTYVFTSDEYNEFVNTQFNDVFAFFVNGANCAIVGGSDPVSINTINNGNPYGSPPTSHPELYLNNDLDDGGGTIDTEMDGLTVPLNCASAVNANVTNHIKLAIADASDFQLDSAVFIQAGSLTTTDVSLSGVDGQGTQNWLAPAGIMLVFLVGLFVWRLPRPGQHS